MIPECIECDLGTALSPSLTVLREERLLSSTKPTGSRADPGPLLVMRSPRWATSDHSWAVAAHLGADSLGVRSGPSAFPFPRLGSPPKPEGGLKL